MLLTVDIWSYLHLNYTMRAVEFCTVKFVDELFGESKKGIPIVTLCRGKCMNHYLGCFWC